jgi:hypothetical protein
MWVGCDTDFRLDTAAIDLMASIVGHNGVPDSGSNHLGRSPALLLSVEYPQRF